MERTYASVIETTATTTIELRRLATELGAVAFGVTDATRFDESLAKLRQHRVSGMSGPLHFTYDDPDTATDVKGSFPWARRLIVFAHSYLADSASPASTGPVVARFATIDQYERLRRIGSGLADELETRGLRAETLIDDNRLVDRAAAARAGVGWLGRSTMLLTPGHGPWLLLGSVVTDADLATTGPMVRTCGTCVACVPACPTGALTPHGLDARRCISTWLQTSGPIPHWVRPIVGRRIYGCDDCLTACPPGSPALVRSTAATLDLSFAELLSMSDASLIERFSWFYLPHREARYLRRNLLVAAGNSGEAEAVPLILGHFENRSSLVRGHAYWAFARSTGLEAWPALRDAYGSETSPDARSELELALLMLRSPVGGR